MNLRTIDLNGDVGEGMASDVELIPLLTSVNIACGGHVGDETSMLAALQCARRAGAAVGAHPSFPDRENFGRREQNAGPVEVRGWAFEQISTLKGLAEREGLKLSHVKPHGALYNQAARIPELAGAIADAVLAIDPELTLFALAGSALVEAGRRRGLRVAAEGFLDRAYLRNGQLAPRSMAGAVLDEESRIFEQAESLARGTPFETADGGLLSVHADTLCVHGDRPNVVVMTRRIRAHLVASGIQVQPIKPF